MEMDTLLPLSGGIDSAYYMWRYLTRWPDKKLLVFHLNLDCWQGRVDLEHHATHAILRWMDAHGLANYEYHEASFSYGSLGEEKHKVRDLYLIGALTGVIIGTDEYKGITTVLLPRSREDLPVVRPKTDRQRSRLAHLLANKGEEGPCSFKFYAEFEARYKHDYIRELPKDLFRLCWYCRRPTAQGKPCGKCATCRRVHKSLRLLGRANEIEGG